MRYFSLLFGLCLSLPAAALQVTVTIPPLAGMVQPFLTEQDELVVLLEPGTSPHGFQFRPSHLMALQKADLVMTLGNSVDAWIEKPVKQRLFETKTSGQSFSVIRMQKQPGLVVLPRSKQDLGGIGKSSAEDHRHDEHQHEHEYENLDPHIWLSIVNARLMLSAVAAQLTQLQPNRSTEISAIAQQLQADYEQLDQKIANWLDPVKASPYLVLHDGYQYFEHAYGLRHEGVVQVSEELKPSIKQVLALRKVIKDLGVRCVFKEPQFSDKQLRYIIQGLPVKVGKLDPLGQDVMDYRQLMKRLAMSMVRCLQPSSP
ncbi:zinc ABC transporter substrate-binding protein [Hydrogenovibrio sp. SC-1]|uniref:zinc ABC transporter substrate-binding protein n=1 Tax=Hydrogenovibrio sp. SC-1 TaxID=2065820 RepID=UPI0013042C83|nr:zinc ABC transporter substrate-binding protein [Hydrogenovibrio sp. SC-1]